MSAKHDSKDDIVLTNRQKSRRAKIGLFWCCKCDSSLVGQGEKCKKCGYCDNPKKRRSR